MPESIHTALLYVWEGAGFILTLAALGFGIGAWIGICEHLKSHAAAQDLGRIRLTLSPDREPFGTLEILEAAECEDHDHEQRED